MKGYPSAISPLVVSKYSSQRNMMKKITNTKCLYIMGSAKRRECFISNQREKKIHKNKGG